MNGILVPILSVGVIANFRKKSFKLIHFIPFNNDVELLCDISILISTRFKTFCFPPLKIRFMCYMVSTPLAQLSMNISKSYLFHGKFIEKFSLWLIWKKVFSNCVCISSLILKLLYKHNNYQQNGNLHNMGS